MREVVTTNFDDLFERASRAIGRKVRALPFESAHADARWILKLHGCVSRPDSPMVLTREDYLRYQDRHAAVAPFATMVHKGWHRQNISVRTISSPTLQN